MNDKEAQAMLKHYYPDESGAIFVTAHHPGKKELSFLIRAQRELADSIPFEFNYVGEVEVFTFEDKTRGGFGVCIFISHRLDYESAVSELIEAGFLEWPSDTPMPWLPA